MPDPILTPAQRLEQLTSLYERHAYLVWNLTLRTTLDPERAAEAARVAFLRQVETTAEDGLAGDAARLAIERARPVDSRALDPPVLAAAAQLAPVQRAALALVALAEASDETIAAALGLEPEAARDLRAGAQNQLAALLGSTPAAAEEAYGDLDWDEPPAEVWHALYPELHAAVTERARAAQLEAAAPAPAPAPARRRSRARVPRVAILAVALLAVAGVAWAATGGGGESGDDAAPTVFGGPDAPLGASEEEVSTDDSGDGGGAAPAPALTAEELDRLRQEEIEDLKRFTRRKADKRLPVRERRQAARKVDHLVELAQQRQRAAERRELALRRALARERAARIRERNRDREREEPEPAPARQPQQPAEDGEPKPQGSKPPRREEDEEPATDDQAECLYDAESGNYICPE